MLRRRVVKIAALELKLASKIPVLCRILAMMLVGSCRIPPPFFGSFGDGFILDGRPIQWPSGA
jgi:hypothetical protein